MAKPFILVVDDDIAICRMIGVLLGNEGYKVTTVSDAHAAIEAAKKAPPDMMLVDWMMPGLSGLDLVRRLRAAKPTRDIPVIMLTAKTEEESVISGLNTGADDYVTKPFSGRELIARIEAVLRRASAAVGPQADNAQVSIGAIVLDPSEHRLYVRGQVLVVSPTEFNLLHFFMRHPNKVFSRIQILDKVWGMSTYVEERTVDVQIRRLRKSLGTCDYAEVIETVRGVGYRLNIAADAARSP